MQLKDLIAQFSQGTDVDNVISDIVKCVSDEPTLILSLVTELESQLISEENGKRAAATQLLADVLQQLPKDFLSEQQLGFFVSFFVDRSRDHIVVLPAVLHAAQALLQQLSIVSADTQKLVLGLLTEVHCQSQMMAVRTQLYTVLRLTCQLHPKAVEATAGDFLLGLISAADGEKDPRNLLLVFSLVTLAVQCAGQQLAPLAEDLFEVVAAYFPIDFVPPAHDRETVTSEDLVSSLRHCLSCTPAWAHDLMALLAEKMESDLPAAKLDAYRTLSACCSTSSQYRSSDIPGNTAVTVWQCVRRDVTADTATEIATAALDALQSLLRVLHLSTVTPTDGDVDMSTATPTDADVDMSTVTPIGDGVDSSTAASEVNVTATSNTADISTTTTDVVMGSDNDVSTADDAVSSLLDTIIKECEPHLTSSSKLSQPALLMLVAAVKSCPTAGQTVCREVLPKVLDGCSRNASAVTIVTAVGQLLQAAALHRGNEEFLAEDIKICASFLQACLVALNSDALTDEDKIESNNYENYRAFAKQAGIRSPADFNKDFLEACVIAAHIGFASGRYWPQLARTCAGVLMLLPLTEQNSSLKETLLDALRSDNSDACSLLTDLLLPACVSSRVALLAVEAVCKGEACVSVLLQALWPPREDAWTDIVVSYYCTISEVLEHHSDDCGVSGVIHTTELLHSVVARSVNLAIKLHTESTSSTRPQLLACLKALTRVCRAVVQLVSNEDVMEEYKQFEAAHCSTENLYFVHIFYGLLVNASDVSWVSEVCHDTLTHWAMRGSCDSGHTACILIACLVNKMTAPENLLSALDKKIQTRLHTGSSNANNGSDVCNNTSNTVDNSPTNVLQCATLIVWVAKALHMRGAHPMAELWTRKLEGLVRIGGCTGEAAAYCYTDLLCQHPDALTVKSHCNVRLLWRQRAFSCAVTPLLQQFATSSNPPGHNDASVGSNVSSTVRQCTLIAITELLPHTPHSILQQFICQLLPVVVEGVRCWQSPAVTTSAVNCLRDMLQGQFSSADTKSAVKSCSSSSSVTAVNSSSLNAVTPMLCRHIGSLVPALLSLSGNSNTNVYAVTKFNNDFKKRIGNSIKATENISANFSDSIKLTDNVSSNSVNGEKSEGSDNSNVKNVSNNEITDSSYADVKMETENTSSSLVSNNAYNQTVPSALELSRNKQPLKVRESSLVCLRLLIPPKNLLQEENDATETRQELLQTIHQYRDEVLRGIRPALDDHKRVVRSAAAQARCAWTLL